MPGQDVIASEAAEVFRDDHIDLFRLDVRDHALKARTFKTRTAPTVVYICIVDAEAVLPDELVQKGFLIGHAL